MGYASSLKFFGQNPVSTGGPFNIAGTVLFTTNAQGQIGQDSNFIWDAVNHRLGISVSVPAYALDLLSSASLPYIARLRSSGANPANILIDNAAGGQQAGVYFLDAGALKWFVGKQTDNTFLLFDSVNAVNFLLCTTAGNVVIGEGAGKTVQTNSFFGVGTGPLFPIDVLFTTGTYGLRVRTSGANNSLIAIDNAAGGNQTGIQLFDGGASKWFMGKNSDNTFSMFDNVNNKNFVIVNLGGNCFFGETGTTTTLQGTFVNGPSYSAVNAVGVGSASAPVAGGSTAFGYFFSTTANLGIIVGSGVPTVSAAQGSLYLRTDGNSTSTRAYINTNGGTTWTAITTVA